MMTQKKIEQLMQTLGIEQYAYYCIEGENEKAILKREQWLSQRIQHLECTSRESRFLRFGDNAHHDVKSVLVALFPYDIMRASQNDIGVVDGFAYGFDYHVSIQKSLERVVDEVETLCDQPTGAQIHVDTSPFIDREIAFYGGLGLYGKNHFLIHPKYGTRFFIGYVTFETTAVIEPIVGVTLDLERFEYPLCKQCKRCNQACPVSICTAPLGDASICVGLLTQTKRTLNPNEREAIGKQLYGCSICQRVCPANAGEVQSFFKHFDDYPLDIRALLTLSNKGFKTSFGHMAFAWRPVNVYKRNILINYAWYGNALDMDYLLSISEQLNHPFLIEVFAWAIETMQKRLKYCDIFRNA